MLVLDTLVTILILGILSVTIAEEEIQSGNERNSTEATVECESYKWRSKISRLERGWEYFPNCDEFLNTTELEYETQANDYWNGTWDALAKKYCSQFPSFIQCTGRMIDSVKPCLDTKSRKIVEDNHNHTSAFWEFLCENDGQRIVAFLSHGGTECATSQNEAMRACNTRPSVDGTLFIASTPPSVRLGQSECAELESFGTCTVTALRKCEDKIPADIVKSLIDLFKSRKSCPSVSAAQASPAA